jgi:hypothetical protein
LAVLVQGLAVLRHRREKRHVRSAHLQEGAVAVRNIRRPKKVR